MAIDHGPGVTGAGRFWRMPIGYGPMPGPRQIPSAWRPDPARFPKRRVLSVSALVAPEPLAALLPPGFGLWGEPVMTVDVTYLTEIEWLAGRGYATFGVKFPALCDTPDGPVHGTFLSVLWENLADPIVSGREELGFSKLYAEIPEPRLLGGRHVLRCAWQGHPFFEMEIEDLHDAEPAAPNPLHRGTLHYKFSPRTGEWGVPDFAGAVLSPAHPGEVKVTSRQTGRGRFAFRAGCWEDLPTLHHIVGALAAIEPRGFRAASVITGEGANDHADQRILRDDTATFRPG